MEPQSQNRYIASTKKKTVNYDRLTVELTAVSKDPMDTYHEYTLNCRSSILSWTIKRRYNSFVTLHQQLCELFPWLTGLAPRIQLPPTKWFGNRKDNFVDKRRKGLQSYLDELLKIPEISKSDIMALFLDPNRPNSEEHGGTSKVPLPMLKSLQIESHFTLNELMLLYSKTKTDNHKIGKDEFSRFVSELGITELNQVELLYGAFTHDGPEANFQDVVLGMSSFTRGTFLEKAKFAFKIYDTNNTGRITREALYSIVLSLDITALQSKDPEDKDLRPEERDSGQTRYFEVLVDRLFRIMSTNNENEVTLEEFMKSCLASHQILAAIGIKVED